MERCFAYWRLPGQDHYNLVSSNSLQPLDLSSIGCGIEGYAIAPFEDSDVCPAGFIPADKCSSAPVPAFVPDCQVVPFPSISDVDSAYHCDFSRFHDSVRAGKFCKLVLSRCREMEAKEEIDLEASFFHACNAFPDMMVALFSSPQTGTWIVSTPEPLLESCNGQCHTVALAGTMLRDGAEPHWSVKNRHEQEIVSDFISGAVAPICHDLRKEGPETMDAGSLVHIKTDIWFGADESDAGRLVRRLHPTPAVCGLPREEAKSFILGNESCERKYFSGYSGPLGFDGWTRLYVSLRCANISSDRKTALLYAGGGIMPESDCRSEFLETENKMQNIARCIVTRKM